MENALAPRPLTTPLRLRLPPVPGAEAPDVCPLCGGVSRGMNTRFVWYRCGGRYVADDAGAWSAEAPCGGASAPVLLASVALWLEAACGPEAARLFASRIPGGPLGGGPPLEMDLPDLAFGQRPSGECPRCGSGAETVDGDERVEGWGSVRYGCHAQYALALPTLDSWRPERTCTTPRATPVLRALRELAVPGGSLSDALAVTLDYLAERGL